jgi:hypothetical protein
MTIKREHSPLVIVTAPVDDVERCRFSCSTRMLVVCTVLLTVCAERRTTAAAALLSGGSIADLALHRENVNWL